MDAASPGERTASSRLLAEIHTRFSPLGGRTASMARPNAFFACGRETYARFFATGFVLIAGPEGSGRAAETPATSAGPTNREQGPTEMASDELRPMDLSSDTFVGDSQSSLGSLRCGHPFHNLLPPRHPMPPCLDTLPPALGAPHN